MADTSGDLDNPFGNWPLANKQMHSALAYMGYDVHFEYADGFGHNSDHGGAHFPEAVKWLWRKEKATPKIDTKGDLRGDLTILKLLVPGQPWEVVADNLGFADAPCPDKDGNFYYSDMRGNAPGVYMVSAANAKISAALAAQGVPPSITNRAVISTEPVSGLKFGPDGLLYGCQGAKTRVISIDPKSGAVKEIATNVTPNDLAVTADGFIYITETRDQHITRINIKTREVTHVDTGINRPNGITLSPDGGTLAVSEAGGENVWTFRVNEGGVLDAKMPTMTMRLPIDPKGEFKSAEPPPYQAAAKGDGSATDRAGRFYVTSALGVQVFDPTGRLCGVLPKPLEAQPLTSCTLAGPDHNYLYITNGTTIFRRKLTVE
jgi:enterochelin esterase family protein